MALSAAPALSLPKVLDPAALEGAYRFFRNASVTPPAILAPHIAATLERAAAEPELLVLHDSTVISFDGESDRELGRVMGEKPGFLAHVSLAVTGGSQRRPLGVLALSTIVRTDASKQSDASEFERWWNHIATTGTLLGGHANVVHVADREGDDFKLFSNCIAHGHRFVVRLTHNRRLDAPKGKAPSKLFEALDAAPLIAVREVPLSRRTKNKAPRVAKTHPPRAGRLARLAISAAKVSLKRPRHAGIDPEVTPAKLDVHVVHVREIDAPTDTMPVSWVLVTTDAVDTPEQILAIVDRYRSRWTIEEYFKALKTGCAYEKRQLESAHSLLNAFALYVPIAWRLLALKTEARRNPDAPAATVFDETTLKVLVRFSRIKLPSAPTVRDAMLAVAALGGHLKHNGEPGWQSLWAGLQQLETLTEGWRAATSARSDQ